MDFEAYIAPSHSGVPSGDSPSVRVDALGCSQNNISSVTIPQPISDAVATPLLPANRRDAADEEERFSIHSSFDDSEPVKPSLDLGSIGDDADGDSRDQCNLYISGLPPGVSERRLSELFAAFGPIVSCKLMLNIHTGESRGFAFVLFQRADSAHRAVAEMDHLLVEGSRLTVRFAEKRARQCGLPTKKVFLRNIPLGVTEGDIRLLLEPALPVVQLSMRPDPYRPTSRPAGAALAPNVAHIIFETFDAAAAAVKLLHNSMPWSSCTVPVLAKVVDTGIRAKREQKRPERSTGGTGDAPRRMAPVGTPPLAPSVPPTYVLQLQQAMPRAGTFPYLAPQVPLRGAYVPPPQALGMGMGMQWPAVTGGAAMQFPVPVPVFAPMVALPAASMLQAPQYATHPVYLHPYLGPQVGYGEYR